MRTCEISLQLHTENCNFSFLQVAVPFLTRTVATGPTPSSHSAPEKNTCMRIRNSVFRLQDLVQLCFVCFWLLTLLPARILVHFFGMLLIFLFGTQICLCLGQHSESY